MTPASKTQSAEVFGPKNAGFCAIFGLLAAASRINKNMVDIVLKMAISFVITFSVFKAAFRRSVFEKMAVHFS